MDVSELKSLFERLFSLTLEKLEGEDRWGFAAVSATRTLLNQRVIERIEGRPEQIPLGSEGLPAGIRQAINSSASICWKSLSSEERQRATSLALQIHTFLIERAANKHP